MPKQTARVYEIICREEEGSQHLIYIESEREIFGLAKCGIMYHVVSEKDFPKFQERFSDLEGTLVDENLVSPVIESVRKSAPVKLEDGAIDIFLINRFLRSVRRYRHSLN